MDKVNMDKGSYVSEIKPNFTFDGVFYVDVAEIREGKRGSYGFMRLVDCTGDIAAFLWRLKELHVSVGDYVYVKGEGGSYNGSTNAVIASYESVDASGVNPSWFKKSLDSDSISMYEAILDGLFQSMGDQYRSVALKIHAMYDEHYRVTPAGKCNHHAYCGGLLAHTVSVMSMTNMICGYYSRINRNVALLGAYVHDIAKIKEYSDDASFSYTREGSLLGHVSSVFLMRDVMDALQGIPYNGMLNVQHILVSHHGYLDGSIKPQTLEALTVHTCDMFDARFDAVANASVGDDGVTERVHMLGTPFMFLGGSDE